MNRRSFSSEKAGYADAAIVRSRTFNDLNKSFAAVFIVTYCLEDTP